MGTLARLRDQPAGRGTGAEARFERTESSNLGAALPVMRFNIAAGALEDVLREFEARQPAGRSRFRTRACGRCHPKVSPASYPCAQALRQILSGTGLALTSTGADTAKLRIRGGA